MTGICSTAIRFADLWAYDYERMITEIYAPNLFLAMLSSPGYAINGHDELRQLEQQLITDIPNHRLELIRVVDGGEMAFIDAMMVAPKTREYCSAGIWWWLGRDGLVVGEAAWADWGARGPDPHVCRGSIARGDISKFRSETTSRELATRFARAWSEDPDRLVTEMFASTCSLSSAGRCVANDPGAIATFERIERAGMRPGSRSMMPQQIIAGEGAIVFLADVTDGAKSTRGIVALTLDENDRVIDCRHYWDWKYAVSGPAGEWPLGVGASAALPGMKEGR